MKPASPPRPIAWGIAPSRPGDTFARRELAEHTRALCAAVHGTRPDADCLRCAGLLRRVV